MDVRWEVLIRQVYWQWPACGGTTKRHNLVGCWALLWHWPGLSSWQRASPHCGAWEQKRDILRGCENLKAVVGKPFGEMVQAIGGAVTAGSWGEGEEGFRTGFQHLNLGAATDTDVPGPDESEKWYEMGTEGKGLEGGWLVGGRAKTENGRNQSEQRVRIKCRISTIYSLCTTQPIG